MKFFFKNCLQNIFISFFLGKFLKNNFCFRFFSKTCHRKIFFSFFLEKLPPKTFSFFLEKLFGKIFNLRIDLEITRKKKLSSCFSLNNCPKIIFVSSFSQKIAHKKILPLFFLEKFPTKKFFVVLF